MRYLALLLLCAAETLFGQGIQFEKNVHDFGHIGEDNGAVLYEFKFSNTGDAPLQIKEVKASCDCTTPGWTMAQVDPTYNGYIKAKYDPTNRPGAFRKSLTVRYSYKNVEYTQTLGITGFVEKGINSRFPAKKGNLKADSEYFSFYSVTTKESYQNKVKIFNAGEKALVITGFENLPSWFKVTATQTKLQPKDSAVLQLTFDPKKRGTIGDVFDSIRVKTDDAAMPVKTFFVLATVHQYFPATSREDSLKAPRLSIPKNTIDVGTIKQGDTVVVNFDLVNTGKSDLKILSTSTTCACTVSKLANDVIRPGEKSELKVTFFTAGKSGKNTKQIFLFTNDPANPEPKLFLKSDILAPDPVLNQIGTKPDSLR